MELSALTMRRAVLFDFDMTLADSSAGIIACVRYALDRLELPTVEDILIRRTIGLPLERTFAALYPAQSEKSQEFARLFVEHADRCMAELTVIFPEAPPLLSWLRTNGYATAIVSTKFRYRIEDILGRNGLTLLFDVIIGGEDVIEHKPSPLGLEAALARLGVAADNALYVGDHPVDQEAARRAGVPFIAVLSGSSGVAEFTDSAGMEFLASVGGLKRVIAAKAGGATI
jgi:phosphoglycolate phosphatase